MYPDRYTPCVSAFIFGHHDKGSMSWSYGTFTPGQHSGPSPSPFPAPALRSQAHFTVC